jgi:tight adherence protein B
MVTTALSAVLGALTGFGLYLVLVGTRQQRRDEGTGAIVLRRNGRPPIARPHELVAAAAVGATALLITHWPMAFALGAAGVLGLKGIGSGPGRVTIAKLESIATWTEMLRDTLAGASGLTQALMATAPNAPEPLSSPVRALTMKLSAGVELETSLRELAEELDDPAADMVVAALLMACRERAQRLGDLLGSLAGAIRDEVTMRLGIEAERASSRTAVRMISGFSMGFFALMAVFARSYLAPYHSATGQMMLGAVGVVFGLGLWLMAVMIRPRPMQRLVLATAP